MYSKMYSNSAYMENASDCNLPLYINNCGNEKNFLHTTTTHRPAGRADYLLLYTPVGKIHFFEDTTDIVYPGGTVILYRPHQPQKYSFFPEDKAESFWVHFSGKDVESILKKFSLDTQSIFSIAQADSLTNLFLQMITECQSSKPFCQEAATLILQNILLNIARNSTKVPSPTGEATESTKSDGRNEITKAINYFNEHYAEKIDIDKYARDLHMSSCWFIKMFRKYAYTTPKQYILTVRISKAKELLESTELSISEVASAVGYSDSMYFSRIFKQLTGVSPFAYRKQNW